MSADLAFGRLLKPGRIGQLELRNRIVMAPMGTGFASAEGLITERQVAYYAERARGGAGLIVVEGSCVDFPEGMGMLNQPRVDDDRCLAGLSRLADAIHEAGAAAAIQLFHAGRVAQSRLVGVQPVAPSYLAPGGGEVSRELNRDEIGAVVQRFAGAARRARKAGFDGVEIHGAHSYLIANFLSRATNKRTDEYGGDLPGRARFLIEIIHACRDAVGPDFPVWVRLNGQEIGMPDGIPAEEAAAVAAMAAVAGAAAVHVSAFGYGHPVMWASSPRTPGFLLPLASAVKQAVAVPVIAVGRMTPALGEQALAAGQADFIAFGRALIADAELPRKVIDGVLDEIRPCVGCVKCRDGLLATGAPITCLVNPALGWERESRPHPAARSKRVVVVGGGPAGMEAARVAALRGHRVVLFEKEAELGGQLIPGARPPEKEDISDLRRYLVGQLAKLGVQVELGRAATAVLVAEQQPDAVVLASGTLPILPDLPGLAKARVVTALAVLAGEAAVGARIAVIGGDLVGCETAEFLAEAGKKVTILRRGPALAIKINPSPRIALLRRLAAKGVRTLTGVHYEAITPEGVVITNAEGVREVIPADTIVLATGGTPERSLQQELTEKVAEVYLIGDCVTPQGILEAMADGQRVGLQL